MYDFILLLFSYYSLGLAKMKEMILHSVQLVSIKQFLFYYSFKKLLFPSS